MDAMEFKYHIYTVSDIRDWLFHNVDNGLSDAVIARPRALAFVNDPHALPEDAALAVVFNKKKEPVGYTGAFAEQWVRPALPERYFWGSTQWMQPQYRGKGVSGKMMRQIKDAVNDKYVALESSIASCRLDEKQGSVISYYPRYFFVLKGSKSLKSRIKACMVKKANKKALRKMLTFIFTNNYVNWIDDATYAFIVSHSEGDLFLRKQDYLNWQLRNPFLVSTGDDTRAKEDACEFGGYAKSVQTQTIQVSVDGKMCGFYVLNYVDTICKVLYLYYDKRYQENVFASVASIVLHRDDLVKFRTFNKDLFVFMKENGVCSMNSKDCVDQVSLTVPGDFVVDPSLHLQGGDGDMVC